jgi:hypothetical protein
VQVYCLSAAENVVAGVEELRIWKEFIISYFKELHWHSPLESEETHEQPVNTLFAEDKCRALPLHGPDRRGTERKQKGKRE